jgi:hypothetical protein
MNKQLDQLFNTELGRQRDSVGGLPPVHLWDTCLCGDIDIVIDREGRWIHEGGEIKRAAMVKLFSSLLRREADDYFLITPEEKWRIKVAIAPFFIISAQRQKRSTDQAISLTARTGEVIVIGENNPLWVESQQSRAALGSVPLVSVRNGMSGLISRDVFYQLVSWGAVNPSTHCLEIESLGERFSLGSVDE